MNSSSYKFWWNQTIPYAYPSISNSSQINLIFLVYLAKLENSYSNSLVNELSSFVNLPSSSTARPYLLTCYPAD
jgi:hypothetical protein